MSYIGPVGNIGLVGGDFPPLPEFKDENIPEFKDENHRFMFSMIREQNRAQIRRDQERERMHARYCEEQMRSVCFII